MKLVVFLPAVFVSFSGLGLPFGPDQNATSTNLLINPGFETGDFTGWRVSGNAEAGVALDGTPIPGTLLSEDQVNVRSGSYAAWAKVDYAAPILELSQVVPVVPNSWYELSFHFTVGSQGEMPGGPGYASVNGDVPLYVLDPAYHLNYGFRPLDYNFYQSFYAVPPGVFQAEVIFHLYGNEISIFGDKPGLAGYSYDDFVFRQVNIPEPSIFLLWWFGGLTLCLVCRAKRALSLRNGIT